MQQSSTCFIFQVLDQAELGHTLSLVLEVLLYIWFMFRLDRQPASQRERERHAGRIKQFKEISKLILSLDPEMLISINCGAHQRRKNCISPSYEQKSHIFFGLCHVSALQNYTLYLGVMLYGIGMVLVWYYKITRIQFSLIYTLNSGRECDIGRLHIGEVD